MKKTIGRSYRKQLEDRIECLEKRLDGAEKIIKYMEQALEHQCLDRIEDAKAMSDEFDDCFG